MGSEGALETTQFELVDCRDLKEEEEVKVEYNAELQAKYRPLDVRRRAVRPCPRTFAAAIDDADHPAYGECGLFARRSLPHGAWVIDYVGGVSLGANEDRSSDYVCDVRPAPS